MLAMGAANSVSIWSRSLQAIGSTVTLSAPDAALLNNLSMAAMGIVPKEAVDANGGTLKTTMVGSGPFMFKENIPDQRLVLIKNPNYFMSGQPYLDQVHLIPARDPDAKLLGLQTGQYDFIDTLPEKNWTDVDGSGDLRVIISEAVGVTPQIILLNNAEGPTSDKRVRLTIRLNRCTSSSVLTIGNMTEIWPYLPARRMARSWV